MKELNMTQEMAELICELEYLIGKECYNPNSYDGWNDIEGCSFRYPINLPTSEGKYNKIRANINKSYFVDKNDINPESVKYMKYKFGSNELYIGQGIMHLLSYLEDRYNIDFNKLESEKTA